MDVNWERGDCFIEGLYHTIFSNILNFFASFLLTLPFLRVYLTYLKSISIDSSWLCALAIVFNESV